MPANASNTNIVESVAAPASAVGRDCTHVNLWDALNGGNSLGAQAISTNPDALALGDRLQFAAGALVIAQPEDTGETNHLSERKVRGAVDGGVWVSYHTDDPGDGTANLIPGIARTPIDAADFTFART